MRHFNIRKNHYHCPLINLDKLWTLVGDDDKRKEGLVQIDSSSLLFLSPLPSPLSSLLSPLLSPLSSSLSSLLSPLSSLLSPLSSLLSPLSSPLSLSWSP